MLHERESSISSSNNIIPFAQTTSCFIDEAAYGFRDLDLAIADLNTPSMTLSAHFVAPWGVAALGSSWLLHPSLPELASVSNVGMTDESNEWLETAIQLATRFE